MLEMSVSAGLNLLLGHHLKARKVGDPEGSRYCDVRGVTTAAHDNAADAGMVVTRIYGVPTAIEKDFGPAAEIHGIGIDRNADVAKIAGAIPRGCTGRWPTTEIASHPPRHWTSAASPAKPGENAMGHVGVGLDRVRYCLLT